MQQATAQGALAGEFIEIVSVTNQLNCKECSSNRVYRVFRKGFFQEKICPWFGYYPWKCKDCKKSMYFRKRKMSRSQDGEYVE